MDRHHAGGPRHLQRVDTVPAYQLDLAARVRHLPAQLPVGHDRLGRAARVQAPAGLPRLPRRPGGRAREPAGPPLGEPVVLGDKRGAGAQRGIAALPEDTGYVLAAAFHGGHRAAGVARLARELGLRVTRRPPCLLQRTA